MQCTATAGYSVTAHMVYNAHAIELDFTVANEVPHSHARVNVAEMLIRYCAMYMTNALDHVV